MKDKEHFLKLSELSYELSCLYKEFAEAFDLENSEEKTDKLAMLVGKFMIKQTEIENLNQ